MKHRGIALLLSAGFAVVSAYFLFVFADASHSINDGATYRFQARILATGALIAPEPPEAEAFRLPMTRAADGKWFGISYPGFPVLLALGHRAGAEWAVNPILGGLLVFGTFLFGRRLFDPLTGLFAAVILAVSPFHLKLASSYLNHTACACLLLFSALSMLRGTDTRPWLWGTLSGFLFGWGTATRPFTGLLIALPIAGLAISTLANNRRFGIRLVAGFTIAAACWGLALLEWNRLLTGDPFVSQYELIGPAPGLGFHEIAPRRGFVPGVVVDYYSLEIAWMAAKRQLAALGETMLPFGTSVFFLLAIPLLGFRTLGRKFALLALSPVALIVGYLLYPGTMNVSAIGLGPRFYSESLPAISLLLARPLVGAGSLHPWVKKAVGASMLGLLLAACLHSLPATAGALRGMHRGAISPNNLLERNVTSLGEGRRVLFVDISTYDRNSAILVNRPDLRGDVIVAIYREPEQNRALLDHFPDHAAFLVRWDATDGFSAARYVPEEDPTGPPDRFPYNRKKRNAARRTGRQRSRS